MKNKFAINMMKAKTAACNLGEIWEDNDCKINDAVIKSRNTLNELVRKLTETQRKSLYNQFDWLNEIEDDIDVIIQ